MIWLWAPMMFVSAWTAEELTLERVTALAKVYFRDSAEVPMSVDVTTLVTNEGGKTIHRAHLTVGMVFNGYNQQSGKFSFRANSGIFSTGALHDSLSGDFAAFFAGGLITKPIPTRSLAIEQESVSLVDKSCPALQIVKGAAFPAHLCGTGHFHVSNAPNGELMFQSFTFDTSGAPAMAKVPHLGDVQIQGFHAAVFFQQGMLPGDAKPYLLPEKTVTSLKTDKGTVTVINLYRPKTSSKTSP